MESVHSTRSCEDSCVRERKVNRRPVNHQHDNVQFNECCQCSNRNWNRASQIVVEKSPEDAQHKERHKKNSQSRQRTTQKVLSTVQSSMESTLSIGDLVTLCKQIGSGPDHNSAHRTHKRVTLPAIQPIPEPLQSDFALNRGQSVGLHPFQKQKVNAESDLINNVRDAPRAL
jgi:hypothetical protein